MKKKIITLIIFSFTILVSACGSDEDGFEILFFTEELGTKMDEEMLKKMIKQKIPEIEEENFSIIFHVALAEKFFIEIAVHEGDLIFVDEDILNAVVDLEDLALPLDSIVSSGFDKNLKESETEEENTYALPLNNEARIIKELNLELETQVAGFIPVYGGNNDLSNEIMEYLVSQE
ncbi:hypothetical protein CR203_13590 [Salipaludibacillus neizhouensis]|uniref:Lipoprotein n=1 Tax=Salipaludibacillus neizhouensis TaxID=885475 RepID=A0A3A9K3C2_9BACI|nr:hypothetical protein [Salipaludibacillus neizhouensis]RKL66859.1 hypothetical protein CR203_13590 [Salipaludibacillus neizhouensis]